MCKSYLPQTVSVFSKAITDLSRRRLCRKNEWRCKTTSRVENRVQSVRRGKGAEMLFEQMATPPSPVRTCRLVSSKFNQTYAEPVLSGVADPSSRCLPAMSLKHMIMKRCCGSPKKVLKMVFGGPSRDTTGCCTTAGWGNKR